LEIVTDPQELKKLQDDKGGDLNQLPTLSPNDEIVLYLGLRPGSILKETKMSSTAGEKPDFRRVGQKV
jgi:DNA-directed RNA polymerase subunit H (RpoH/RPB5)